MNSRQLFALWTSFCLWSFCFCGWTLPANAHKPSDSYLKLAVQGNQIQGQWDIALRDLDYAMGLDDNGDGAITWGELRAQKKEVTAYALSRLELQADGVPCPAQLTQQLADNHTDGAYSVLRFVATCPQKPNTLGVNYRLFFDLDPQHRGLLSLETQGLTRTAIFSPTQGNQSLPLVAGNPVQQFLEFVREGTWHIWIGFDHILFLLTLLLPAVLERKDGRWKPVLEVRSVFGNVLKVVTAFTVAHSITLSLATLGVIQLPSRWVESAIALSVILSALNNIYPLVQGRRWIIAFGFGLIHGFGFASVLADLGLPQEALLRALIGFNLGVEVGQIAIVCAFLPLAFALRDSWFYRQVPFKAGSISVAVVASIWMMERLFDFKALPF
jgi:HupE / UreJ protein